MSTERGMDAIKRLQVVAAALPGSTVVMRYIPLPLTSVWAVIEDLEHFAPLYEGVVRETRFEEHDARRMLRVTYVDGEHERYDVRLSSCWCLIQSASFGAGFAARVTEQGTLLAHLEYWRIPGHRPASPNKLEAELLEIERLALASRS